MQVSMEAKRNGVTFRRPTFKNPLPKFFKSMFTKLVNTYEVAGMARAAAELSRMGYHEEAKNCMMRLKELRRD